MLQHGLSHDPVFSMANLVCRQCFSGIDQAEKHFEQAAAHAKEAETQKI